MVSTLRVEATNAVAMEKNIANKPKKKLFRFGSDAVVEELTGKTIASKSSTTQPRLYDNESSSNLSSEQQPSSTLVVGDNVREEKLFTPNLQNNENDGTSSGLSDSGNLSTIAAEPSTSEKKVSPRRKWPPSTDATDTSNNELLSVMSRLSLKKSEENENKKDPACTANVSPDDNIQPQHQESHIPSDFEIKSPVDLKELKEDDSQIESQSVPETANVSLVSSDTPVSTDSIPAPDKDEAQQELEPAAAVTEDDSKTLNKTGNDNYLNTSLENKQHEADVSEVMYEGAANQDIEADGFLLLRKRVGIFGRVKWKQRYVLLRKSRLMISRSKTTQPKSIIDIDGHCVADVIFTNGSPATQEKTRDFSFDSDFTLYNTNRINKGDKQNDTVDTVSNGSAEKLSTFGSSTSSYSGHIDKPQLRIITDKRTYFFRTSSDQEAFQWAARIQAIQRHQWNYQVENMGNSKKVPQTNSDKDSGNEKKVSNETSANLIQPTNHLEKATEQLSSASSQTVSVTISRESPDISFGISIVGGLDAHHPKFQNIVIVDVKKDSIVKGLLFKYDRLLEINDTPLTDVTHAQANQILSQVTGDVRFVVLRKRRRKNEEPHLAETSVAIANNSRSPTNKNVNNCDENNGESRHLNASGPSDGYNQQSHSRNLSTTSSISQTSIGSAVSNDSDARAEMRRRLSERRLQRKQSQRQELDDALRVIYELPE